MAKFKTGMDVGQNLLDAMGLGDLHVTAIDISVHMDDIVSANIEVHLDNNQIDGLVDWTAKQRWVIEKKEDLIQVLTYDAQKFADEMDQRRVNEIPV